VEPWERVAGTDVYQREGVGTSKARLRDYVALLKPRVMSLVVFTGGVGLAVPEGPASARTVVATLVCIAAGAGGCGALNMWYDADIDRIMTRTRRRPIPQGNITPEQALVFGSGLVAVSVPALGALVNWLAAALLAFTIVFYVLIYTMGLKRRTPQNIVIGGASGALPPMIGWAAATGSLDATALALFLIIFLWTPPHFWALAIARSADYSRAGVPMMPVVAGVRHTTTQILVYTLLLSASSLAPWALGAASVPYAAIAMLLNAVLIWRALGLWMVARKPAEDISGPAMKLFGFSILYLFAI